MRAPPWARRLLSYALVAAAVAFLALTVARNWRQLRTYEWEVEIGLLLVSVAAHVAVLIWGVFLWSRVLAHFAAQPVPFPALLRIWSLSNATRYIPGTVWQFLTAAKLSREEGLGGVLALTSMLVHVALSLLAALTVSALVIPATLLGLSESAFQLARVAVVVLALLAVHPALLNAGLRLVPRALHREVLSWHGSWGDGVALLLLANLSWLLYGGAYTLFVASLTDVPLAAVIPLTAVNAISFFVGYVAVIAPGGIGVRESAMTVLLTPLMPVGVAAVVSIAARLWSVVAEVAIVLGSGMWAARRREA